MQALHVAANFGHVAVVSHLLGILGTEARSERHDGMRPLSLAVQAGHVAVAEHLVSREAKASSTTNHGS